MKIPYHRQERFYTCGIACIRMILNYYGTIESEETLIENTNISEFGLTCPQIAETLKKFDINAIASKELTIEDIINSLDKNEPLILLVDAGYLYGGRPAQWHFIVVIDKIGDYIIYHNPLFGEKITFNIEKFLTAWERTKHRGVRIWK